MKDKKNYLIIIIYGLLLTILLVGVNNIYGADIDWFTQHTIIPDYFRNLFYETGKFIPDLAFNIGAGQNIFNLSYYGLMNPVILVSYLLPFIDMRIYIMLASFILYIASGLLFYKFIKDKDISENCSLLLSLAFLSITPITFHFHYHLMFVWYFPFLIMAFIGVDEYLKRNNSLLLMISIFLIIMTNYYYAVPSIVVILIYGAYSLLKKEQTIKTFIIDVLKASPRVIIPILVASFILLPTLYTITSSDRTSTYVALKDIMLFNISEGMYASFTTGISLIFIISIIGNLCSKTIKKDNLFLNITLLLITLSPLFMYALNGFLYVRGKVLIPFIILYFVAFISFIKKFINHDINLKYLYLGSIILILFIILTNLRDNFLTTLFIDIIITFISLVIFYKTKKTIYVLVPLIILLLVTSFNSNVSSKYISKELWHRLMSDDKHISSLINSINDNSFYRTDINTNENKYMNKIVNKNHFSTTIYSSTYNSYYKNFYNFEIANNIVSRNSLITVGTNNPLFNQLMGVKYLVTENNIPLNYEVINSSNKFKLLKNKNVNPIIYTTDKVGSNDIYDSLSFPYNIEYMMYNPITESTTSNKYNSTIKKLNWNLLDKYELNLDKSKTYTYKLNETISNKYLIISFDMNYNQSCSIGDVSITINGIKNKLTCKEWLYHNKNNNFQYIISSNDDINELSIKFTKGKYNISNINIYTMDNTLPSYKDIDNLEIDKAKSTITGSINNQNDSYIITSIPYDKGFKVYVDDKKIDSEIVNKAFLGFKVVSGNHNIKIVYSAPLHTAGKVLSLFGLIGFASILFIEKNDSL